VKSFFFYCVLGCATALIFALIGSSVGGDSGALVGILIASLFVAYFLPAYIAYSRRCPSPHAILALNIFLGWTLIGWVVALVWSLRNYKYSAPVAYIEKKE